MARRQAAATSWAQRVLIGLPKIQEHPTTAARRCPDSKRASPHYGCGVLAAGRPVQLSVGPEGLEPSPGGLRVRCAATSTLIPSSVHKSARKESNLLPGPYKRPALTVELRAAQVGPEGIEPSPAGLKVRCAAAYTTTLCLVGRMRFQRSAVNCLMFLSSRQVVALRVELSATCSSDRCGQPALGYRVLSVAPGGSRTRDDVLPKHVGQALRRLSYRPVKATKKPGVARDTGFWVFLRGRWDQVSQAQWMHGQGIRRLTGTLPPAPAFGDTWS
jgi:hypothetical protein